jgi:hypothetical protein
MMPPSSRRLPPSYPTPTVPPRAGTAAAAPATKPAAGARPASPPRPPAPAYTKRPARDVVVRTFGLKLLSVVGILQASMILMLLVVLLVMALGGDARVGMIVRTIKGSSTAVWSWTLFALFTSFVLGAVMLYNAIATLSLIPWSERATKLWSAVWLALSVVTVIVNLGWVYPLLREASPDRFTFARTLAVTWLHLAAGVVWPAFVLFYMNTRHVKQAYARVASGASAM